MMITLLGTGSPDPSRTRASSGYLVEVAGELLLFDHGAGAHENFLRTGHDATEVDTLFLSHLHSDHTLDYARFIHSRWDQGAGRIPEATVFGPAHTARMSERLFGEDGVLHADLNGRINAPGSQRVHLDRGGSLPRRRPEPRVVAIHDGMIIENAHWKVTVREVLHQPGFIDAFGFRLESDAGIFAYSGDTGPCDGIRDLAMGADLLVHMCYFVSGTFSPVEGPLTASGHMECARLAADAGVRTLVTTHMPPSLDAPGVKLRCLGEMAEIYDGRIVWGEDLMTLTLPSAEIGRAA